MTPGIMVAMEGTCIAFLLVVLSAYTFLSRFRTLRKDWYFYSLVLTLVGLITDLIAWACELGPSNEVLQFASMVTRHFPHDSVYRISGDEFVVVASDMDKAAFDRRIESLRAEINENSGIAALGTISGTGDMIPGLIKEAEMAMYAGKKSFYTHNPEYKRGKTAYMNS